MECPVCGLVNPPHSLLCDCGHDFAAGTGGSRPPLRVRHPWLFWLGVLIVVAIPPVSLILLVLHFVLGIAGAKW